MAKKEIICLLLLILSLTEGYKTSKEYTGLVIYGSLGEAPCPERTTQTCYRPSLHIEIPIASGQIYAFQKNCDNNIECAVNHVNVGQIPHFNFNVHTKMYTFKHEETSKSISNINNMYIIFAVLCSACVTWIFQCFVIHTKGRNSNDNELPQYSAVARQTVQPIPPPYTPDNTQVPCNTDNDNVSVNSDQALLGATDNTEIFELDMGHDITLPSLNSENNESVI